MIRRRNFITLLGGAAAWPLAVGAQQRAMPVVGYLELGSPESNVNQLTAFRKGLSETGFVEGSNVTIVYRWAYNDNDRLSALAADLVSRRVAVIAAIGGIGAAFAAKAETTIIPIVFRTGTDPVQTDLVASLNRPGGNITGINSMASEIVNKRLGLLHELLPRAARFAVLIDPRAIASARLVKDLQEAASTIRRQLEILSASSNREIDMAFASLVQKRTDGLLVAPHILFLDRHFQVVTLATHHRVPTIYSRRDFAEIGGLMSYGASETDPYRQAGIYTGRILKGEKPADLPIMRATKFEFVINLQTARLLGIDVPPTLLAIADEVIE
jgi:putative ABC transport system substrate-binding protein